MVWLFSMPCESDQLAAPPPHAVHCGLIPNPWLIRNGLKSMVPVQCAILLIVIVTSLLSTTGLFDTIEGQYVGIALVLPIFVAGTVLGVRRSLRRDRPVSELEIDEYELSARDIKTGVSIFRAPRVALTYRRGLRRYRLGRGPEFQHAVLIVEAAGQKPLSIGVNDARFSWGDSNATVGAPRYIVGVADWTTLAQALGLSSAALWSGECHESFSSRERSSA